jgi:hypothetical protein
MSYLKNLAESLSTRVIPSVSRQVFGNEHNKLADFNEKLDSAKEVFAKAKTDVVSTGHAFAGIGPTSKKLASQLRSGKIGLSKEEEDEALMKSMGLDALDNIDFGGEDSTAAEGDNVTNNNTVTNNFSVNGAVADSLTQGDALINERLTVNSEITTRGLQNLTGLSSSMASNLNRIAEFQANNTATFYETSLDNSKLGASLVERLEPMLDDIKGFYKSESEKREALAAQKALGKTGGEGLDGILDPEAMLRKFTDGNFAMMFGEMSPLRGMLDNISKDPLGTMAALGLGGLVTSVFSSQVEFIKKAMSSIEYRVQGTLENWSNLVDDPDNPSPLGMVKRKLGEMLKASRDTDLRLGTGGYTDEAAFDGQTRKAIVDVIPMYLSKILRALSDSKDHEVYDYQSGRFRSGHDLNRQNQKELARIDRGQFAGGLGNDLKYGLMSNDKLKSHEKTKIQKEVFRQSLGNNSHNAKMEDIQLSTPELTAKFQDHYKNLSREERGDFERSFRASRFERSQELAKYQAKFNSTGMEAANILNNKDYGLRTEFNEETGLSKKPRPHKPPKPPAGPNPGGNPDIRLDRNGKPRPILDVWGDKITRTMKRAKVRAERVKRRVTKGLKNGWDKIILNPLKNALVGARKADNMSFLDSLKKSFNKNILFPLKKALMGSGKSAKDIMKTSFIKSLGMGIDRTILMPFKHMLVGKDRAKKMSILESISTRFSESILVPFKQKLLGSDKETAERTSLMNSLSARLDKSIVFPLKQALLGADADKDTVGKTSLMSSIGKRLDMSVLMPLKIALLGGNKDQAKKLNFFQAISKSWADNITFPMKKALLGGNGTRANKMSFMEAMGNRFTTSVLMPIKTVLLGGESRSQKEVFQTTFMKAISTGFNERILQPISGLLFGEENKKKGIFNNLGTMMSPFFNKLLFGADKASKGGFLENLKTGSKDLWNSVWSGAKEKFFTPLMGSIKELFGPVFKDFRDTIGAELKHFGKTIFGSVSGGIKVGAKGLFKDVFGDETVKLLRDNIITPLKDLTSKLNDSIGKVFKFLIRMPINLLKGVTDSVKIKRMEGGRGNYSDAEKARLTDLKKNNKLFNFMDLGPSSKKVATVNPSNAVTTVDSKGKPVVSATNNDNSTTIPVNAKSTTLLSDEDRKRENARLWRESANEGLKSKDGAKSSNGKDLTVSPVKTTPSVTSNNTTSNTTVINNNSSSNTTNNSSAVSTVNNSKSLVNTPVKTTPSVPSIAGSFSVSDIASIGHAASVVSRELPIVSKGSNAASDLLAFAKSNLSKLDARLENVVKLLRKQNGVDVKGVKGSNLSIIRNPFQWIGNKFDKLTGFATKLTGSILGTVGKVANSLASIPGKIIGSVTSVVTTAANSLMKVSASLIEGAGKAISASISFASKALEGIADGMGKVVSGLGKAVGAVAEGAGQFLGSILGPLGKSIGTLTTSIAQGLGPVLASVGKAMGSLIEGARIVASEFGKLAFSLAKNTAVFAGKALGRLTGMTMGFNKDTSSESKNVFIENFKQMFADSKATPLRVIVVDGKIGTYGAKTKRATTFTDKNETRSLLGKKGLKAVDAPEKDSFLGKMFSGLAGLFTTNPLGKLLMGVGGATGTGALGGVIGKLKDFLGGGKKDDGDDSNAKKKKTKFGLATKALGNEKLSGKIDETLGVDGASEGINAVLDHYDGDLPETNNQQRRGRRGRNRAGRPTPPKKGIMGSLARLGTKLTPEGGFSSMLKRAGGRVMAGSGASVGGIGSKLIKGGGIGAALGIGGGIAADALFEKGGAMHAMTSTGTEYAGYGALLGSIVPGLGTAAGALIGGIIGTVKEGIPRLLKWVEQKFESEIRGATEYLIQIPERITAFAAELPNKITEFVQTLPEKITGFLDGLPGTIVRIFAPDANQITVDENGNVVEDKPSILGRMFVALGSAIGSIVMSIPKIVVSLMEGMGKLIITAGSSAATLAAKGIFSVMSGLFDTVGKTFDVMTIKAKNLVPSMLGGMSDEERDAAMKEVDKKYEARAAERSSTLVSMSDKGVDVTKSLTSWSIADKMGSQDPSNITKDREAYNKAMSDAGGDNAKGKELFKQRMIALGKDTESAEKEFTLQQGEEDYRKKNITTGIAVNGDYQMNTGATANSSYSSLTNIDPKTFSSEQVADAIKKAADYSGIPFKVLDKIADIESSHKYWAVNKSGYKGLFQMGNDEFAKFSPNPTGSPLDPYNNAMAAANYMMYHAKEMKNRDIPVTPENLYLAHQQGLGGVTTINKAVQAGQPEVDSPTIRRNMLNNPPQDGKGATSNPSAFMSRWASIVNNGAASNGTIGVMAPTASPNAVSMASGNGSETAPAEVDQTSEALNKYISAISGVGNVGGYKHGGQGYNKGGALLMKPTVSVTPPEGVAMIPESETKAPVNTVNTNVAATPEAPMVTTNINSEKQVETTVQAVANARNAPVESNVDPVANAIASEMSKQTALLADIAENTKASNAPNFFTGAPQETPTKKPEAKQTIQNISNQDIHANFLKNGNKPLMLAPGKGAVTMARAGSAD